MNPHQKNKIDINERKYFDSGDYALSKAGKASDAGVTQIGSQHPLPENIPHLTSPSTAANNGLHVGLQQTQLQGHPNSPIKESRFSSRENNAGDESNGEGTKANGGESSVNSPVKEGIPLRWQS
ncbi:MAG: hypothetical protein M1839_006489 [Geoglossum umbratile]|nr:MAG: hypothetical protein M1839_006489 [Geoglossum umbratile]